MNHWNCFFFIFWKRGPKWPADKTVGSAPPTGFISLTIPSLSHEQRLNQSGAQPCSNQRSSPQESLNTSLIPGSCSKIPNTHTHTSYLGGGIWPSNQVKMRIFVAYELDWRKSTVFLHGRNPTTRVSLTLFLIRWKFCFSCLAMLQCFHLRIKLHEVEFLAFFYCRFFLLYSFRKPSNAVMTVTQTKNLNATYTNHVHVLHCFC